MQHPRNIVSLFSLWILFHDHGIELCKYVKISSFTRRINKIYFFRTETLLLIVIQNAVETNKFEIQSVHFQPVYGLIEILQKLNKKNSMHKIFIILSDPNSLNFSNELININANLFTFINSLWSIQWFLKRKMYL